MPKQRFQNQNEKKVDNSQNIADLESEAKESFAELVDEVKNSFDDERNYNLKSKDKNKVLEYYKYYVLELKNIKWYGFLMYSIVVFWWQYVPSFARLTNSYLIDTMIQSICLFLSFFLITVYLLSEKNLENFFLKMFPNFAKEKKASDIAIALKEEIFPNKKENGFRKAFTFLFILILIDLFVVFKGLSVNLNWAGLFLCGLVLVIHKSENSVFKNI